MGTVGALSVAIAVLIAITLTPALLSLVGERVLRGRERAALASRYRPRRPRSRSDRWPPGMPIGRVLLGVGLLVTLAVPATVDAPRPARSARRSRRARPSTGVRPSPRSSVTA